MAEFSKQWAEKNDPEFPYDFDIIEIASKLDPGYCLPIICEGFGFVAVGKDEESNILIAMPTGKYSEEGREVTWKPLAEIIE